MSLTPARIAAMMREYQDGVPVALLSEKYGIPVVTIQRVRRQMGIPSQRAPRVRQADIELAKQMLEENGK